MSSQEAEQSWQEDVFRVLKAHDVKHVVFVPDAGHSAAIRMSYDDPEIKAVVLTTEEEGIGYLAGAWLGGERGALLMQSSGVGNVPEDVAPLLHGAATMAFNGDSATALLLGQRLIGEKKWVK